MPNGPDWLPFCKAWRLEIGWMVTFPSPTCCMNGWTLIVLFMTWGWSCRPGCARTELSMSGVAEGAVGVPWFGKICVAPPMPTPDKPASGRGWTTCVRPVSPNWLRSSSASASWRLCSVMLASARLRCKISQGSWFVPTPLLPLSPPGDPPKMSSSRKSKSTLTLGRPGSIVDSWACGWTSGTWPWKTQRDQC